MCMQITAVSMTVQARKLNYQLENTLERRGNGMVLATVFSFQTGAVGGNPYWSFRILIMPGAASTETLRMCVTPMVVVGHPVRISLSFSLFLDGFVSERRDNLQEKEVSCGLTFI